MVLVGSLSVTTQLSLTCHAVSVLSRNRDSLMMPPYILSHSKTWKLLAVPSLPSRFGLTVSFTKTKAMVVNAPSPPSGLLVLPEGSIELVPDFTYLCSCMSSDGQMTVEISTRLAKASRAFGTLRSSVLSDRDPSIKTKVHVYSAVVLLILLYGCETCRNEGRGCSSACSLSSPLHSLPAGISKSR